MPRLSAFPKTNGQVVSPDFGPLERRAVKAVGQAALHNLIQDMARALDNLTGELAAVRGMVTEILIEVKRAGNL